MASSFLPLLLLFTFSVPSFATHPRTNLFRSELKSTNDIPPTTVFEVTKPIQLPKTKSCSTLLLQHDFGFTFGQSPALAQYNPPSNCPSTNFAKIVLEWNATCKGRQYDRIFGVWLGGVELLRSSTAEPRATGIVWTVKKDITRYYSLLMMTNQTLAVYLGNLVDATYTGVYHVNVSIHFYPAEEKYGSVNKPISDDWADLVLPISRNLPLNDGLWFEIGNSNVVGVKQFIPQNAYRSVLEVYVSFHENDEFWYTNFPNEYISEHNITDERGNGPFREVVVSLDGTIVGAVWPFTVIYTGGFSPLLWSPISGIGSFDLPSYDIEITPLLGTILDGKTHEFGFGVTNALNVWYVDANLHIWLDGKSEKTEGKLLKQEILPLHVSLVPDFTGLNGTYLTRISRSIESIGWVLSSKGKIVTNSKQEFNYSNIMFMGNNRKTRSINQIINFNDSVSSSIHSKKSLKRFPFYWYSDILDQGNESFTLITNLTLGFNEKKVEVFNSESLVSYLQNSRNGQVLGDVKGSSVVSALWSTQQEYNYGDDEFCYFRDISSSNYTILNDKEGNSCTQ